MGEGKRKEGKRDTPKQPLPRSLYSSGTAVPSLAGEPSAQHLSTKNHSKALQLTLSRNSFLDKRDLRVKPP